MKRIALLAIGLVTLLSGCSSPALTLSASESDLPLCAANPDPVAVETLESTVEAKCKLSEVTLLFPDTTTITIDKYASAGSTTSTTSGSSETTSTYSFYNVGIYGFVAAMASPGCDRVREWGSPEGKTKLNDAFGKNWPCG